MTEGKERRCSCEENYCHQLGTEKTHIFNRKTKISLVKPVVMEKCVEYQIQEHYLSQQKSKNIL